MEPVRVSYDVTSTLLNDDLHRELRMLVSRGLTPEQLRAHYRLNGAPERFADLVFETAKSLEQQAVPEKPERNFWKFLRLVR